MAEFEEGPGGWFNERTGQWDAAEPGMPAFTKVPYDRDMTARVIADSLHPHIGGSIKNRFAAALCVLDALERYDPNHIYAPIPKGLKTR